MQKKHAPPLLPPVLKSQFNHANNNIVIPPVPDQALSKKREMKSIHHQHSKNVK